jgi:hypothetical protein
LTKRDKRLLTNWKSDAEIPAKLRKFFWSFRKDRAAVIRMTFHGFNTLRGGVAASKVFVNLVGFNESRRILLGCLEPSMAPLLTPKASLDKFLSTSLNDVSLVCRHESAVGEALGDSSFPMREEPLDIRIVQSPLVCVLINQ